MNRLSSVQSFIARYQNQKLLVVRSEPIFRAVTTGISTLRVPIILCNAAFHLTLYVTLAVF